MLVAGPGRRHPRAAPRAPRRVFSSSPRTAMSSSAADRAAAPLASLVGRWTGTSTLLRPWLTPVESTCAGTARVGTTAHGLWLTIEYEWALDGEPQQGFLLVGREPEGDAAHASWVDSWHQRAQPMASAGVVRADGTVEVRGRYAAPPGPDWGWRTVLAHTADDAFELTMINVTPDGEEAPAVRARYTRA